MMAKATEESQTRVEAMFRQRTHLLLLLVVLVTTARAGEPKVIDLGDRLELFVDSFLIERMEGAKLKLHSPREAEVVWRYQHPLESPKAAYFTVFQDGDDFRMFYRASPRDMPDMICTMVSPDGIKWKRPELGLFEFRGTKKNNIIWKDGQSRITHMFAPFKDTRPDVPDDQRYKALAGSPIHALASSDGIRWRLLAEKPILTGTNFDSLNVAFWDARRNHYVLYCRHRLDGGVRFIATATSKDFFRWSERQPIDVGDAPVEHLYTNGTLPYYRAPHIYLSLAKRFLPERKRGNDGVSDAVLMSSRDGLHFDRTFLEAWIRPGPTKDNWLARSNMPAWGILQTGPEELSVYYSQGYGTYTSQLRRGVLRLDGFVSVSAPYDGGELVTKSFRFRGNKLVLNYATSAAGSVKVEFQDTNGRPIPGWSLSDATAHYGDSTAEAYVWKKGENVSPLAGKTVRLRLVMKDADLYSLRFAP